MYLFADKNQADVIGDTLICPTLLTITSNAWGSGPPLTCQYMHRVECYTCRYQDGKRMSMRMHKGQGGKGVEKWAWPNVVRVPVPVQPIDMKNYEPVPWCVDPPRVRGAQNA